MDNKKSLLQQSGIRVGYHSELMQNYVSESIINFGKGLQTVKHTKDEAFLFFIDNKNALQVLVHSTTEGSGWKMHQVSETGYKVTAFNVFEEKVADMPSFRISYARAKGGVNQLLVSNLLVIQNIDTKTWNCNYQWTSKQVVQPEREIDHITLDQQGLLYSTNATKADANYCYFKYAAQPAKYTLPENGREAKQIQLGKYGGYFGVFMLYYIGKEKTMLFQAIEEDDDEEILQKRFLRDIDINGFDLLPDAEGNSVLYAAGDGIYRVIDRETDNGIKSVVETIVKADVGLKFTTINASQLNDEVAVWTVGKSGAKTGLYYNTNRTYNDNQQAGVGKNWTPPMQMLGNISNFVSVKGENLLNQLYLFDAEAQQLVHFWQDAVTTKWKEQALQIENMDHTIDIQSYTIHLNFTADKMDSLKGKKIGISSAENIAVYINNQRRFLTEQTPVMYDVETNQMINIVFPVDSLEASSIILSGDCLDNAIEINPTSGVMKKLAAKLSSADALKNAKTQKGESLVDKNTNDSTLKEVAKAIADMNKADSNVAKAPQLMAMGAATALSDTNILGGGFWDATKSALGDVWHAVEKGYAMIEEYTIKFLDNACRVVMKIAGQIFDFIIDTVKKVVAFVVKVFNKIGTFFKKLFEFLAFLFNWEDIIATKRALKGYTLGIIEGFEDNLTKIQNFLVGYLQEVQDKVRKELEWDKLSEANKKPSTNNTEDSRTSFVSSKKEYLAKDKEETIQNLPKDLQNALADGFGSIMEGLTKYQDLILQSLNIVGSKFMAFFKGEISLIDLLKYIALSLANIGLEIAKDIINLLFNAIKALINIIKISLKGSINIPFFSALYKKVAGDDLSVLDLICLLIAIPTTVGYKLGMGEAPFKALNEKDYINSSKKIFAVDFAY
jgi:hypothetical protein